MRVQTGLCRDDVVDRPEMESPARREPDAEIFGMAVGGAKQPKHDLRFEESPVVGVRRVAAFEEFRNLAYTGTTFRFIFARRRDR